MSMNKSSHIPIPGDRIPTDRPQKQAQCPYPVQESIVSISPPSYDSLTSAVNRKGTGCKIT